jgi:muconolactone delta-isomerase
MNTFMASITMPDFKDSEFLSLIPKERLHIDRLMEKGIISTYTLSADRTRLWVTINAESLDDTRTIVDAFPLRKFMAVEITELTFHHSASLTMPTMSMN